MHAQAPISAQPFRVGVLFSTSGHMAVIEHTQLLGTLLAIEEINDGGGILGRELQPVVYNPASDIREYVRLSWRLLVEDEVNTIFGCYLSSSRKAILPMVERFDALLWYPTLYEGFEFSPNVIYTGACPNQNSLGLARYLLAHHGPRIYLVGSDYVYAHESNRIMRELIEHEGGEVAGERYARLDAIHMDFVPIVGDLRRQRPDAVFSTVVGDATAAFYQAFMDAGLDGKAMPIASLTTTEAEVSAMGRDVAEGHITSAPYFQSVEGAGNSRFVSRYKARYGQAARTNACAEAAYYQVHLYAATVAAAGAEHSGTLRSLSLGLGFDAPQGPICIDPQWGHADLWTRIGRVNETGTFDIIHQSRGAVHADPYLVGYGRAASI